MIASLRFCVNLINEFISISHRNPFRNDIAFELAKLHYQLDNLETVITYLHHSINDYGEASDSCYNLALCYNQLGQAKESQRWLTKSLAIDPNYQPAKQLEGR